MNPYTLTLAALVSLLVGCATTKPAPPTEEPHVVDVAPPAAQPVESSSDVSSGGAPAPESTGEVVTQTEEATEAPPPECSEASECAQKGSPGKGMHWACVEGKCTAEKKVKTARTKSGGKR